MTIEDLRKNNTLQSVHLSSFSKEISGPFCCDLLSIAMSRGFKDCVWITVMANLNTIAVASLIEVGALIFAEGMKLEEGVLQKAMEENIPVFYTEESIFETALKVYEIFASKKEERNQK